MRCRHLTAWRTKHGACCFYSDNYNFFTPFIRAAGTFLRGVLDKVGVEPQVQRIGAYKSAGDQLLRRDMSEAQREQLGELLDDIYDHFLDTVAEARGKTREVGGSGGFDSAR
jgi:hypothetical protein